MLDLSARMSSANLLETARQEFVAQMTHDQVAGRSGR
jgi:hypothetical protein